MDCADVADRAAAYLDTELSPGERTQLEDHVDQCGECRVLLERLSAQDLAAPFKLDGLDEPALGPTRFILQPDGNLKLHD